MSHMRRITNQQALQALVRELELEGYSKSAPYLELVLPEVIRNCLYNVALAEGEGVRFSPVYTSRLTSAVRRQADTVWPLLHRLNTDAFFSVAHATKRESEDPIQWHLRKLAQFGDVISLNEGYWLPAPIRIVPFPDGDGVMLGGMATRDLRRHWPNLRVGGYGRLLGGNWPSTSRELGLQNYEDWVGWRPNDLLAWTKEQIQRTIADGSSSSSSFNDYDVYVSSWELRRRSAQPWFPARELDTVKRIESVLLCRTRLKPRQYFLGHFDGPALIRETSVGKEHVRWLQLGLGLLHGYQPTASWDGITLSLFPLPPPAVERHLLAYAGALSPASGTFKYCVHPACKETLSNYLSEVGYQNHDRGGTST